MLMGRFGPIDFATEFIPFEYTSYYADEMGFNQKRRFISFKKLINPDALPKIKLITNEIEKDYSEGGKRKINIDPGYISLGNMILATGKPYAHRPYLKKGIYADLTLIYKKGGFQPLEWTYPDYREAEILQMLAVLRGKYLIDLLKTKKEAPKTE